MADTTKTIQSASNSELSAILYRVRRERDCLQLLRDIQATATPNPNNPYPDWEKLGPFSTETVVYNGKSIKQMTDQELSEYLDRLRNESELINVIQNINRYNKPTDNSVTSDSTPYPGLNLNTPIEDLYHNQIDKTLEHFGIPGMRWGVRRGAAQTGKGSADYQQSRALKKKGMKNLSTAELRTLNDRIQQERNYKNLNPNAIQKGQKAAGAILAGMAAVTTVYKFAHSPAGKAVGEKAVKIIAKIARG